MNDNERREAITSYVNKAAAGRRNSKEEIELACRIINEALFDRFDLDVEADRNAPEWEYYDYVVDRIRGGFTRAVSYTRRLSDVDVDSNDVLETLCKDVAALCAILMARDVRRLHEWAGF